MTLSFMLKNPYLDCTVKRLLGEHLFISRKIRHFLRIKKHSRTSGEMINWQSSVKTGDTIHLILNDDNCPQKEVLFGQIELVDCLYRDEHLTIVNKPEGAKIHSNEPSEVALFNHVSTYIGQTCYVIHRLDMETSGAVMFARNLFVLPITNRLLENKDITRECWALVQGKFEPKYQVFQDKIGRDRRDHRKRVVDRENGQTALTIVNRLKVLPNGTLAKCRLKTGRTHQTCVHLSAHNHVIIGDPLYSKASAKRLMLHAHKLSLTRPFTPKKIGVEVKSQTFEASLSQKQKHPNR